MIIFLSALAKQTQSTIFYRLDDDAMIDDAPLQSTACEDLNLSAPNLAVPEESTVTPETVPLISDQNTILTLSPLQMEKLVLIKKILDQIEVDGGISMFGRMWSELLHKVFNFPTVTQAAKIILQTVHDESNPEGRYIKRFLQRYHLLEIEANNKCSVTNIKCDIEEFVRDICYANSIDFLFKECP